MQTCIVLARTQTDTTGARVSAVLVIVQDVVAGNFVMFALPVALDAKDLQCPVDTLEVDIVWPIDFDYLGGGCEIKIGEAKSRATCKSRTKPLR